MENRLTIFTYPMTQIMPMTSPLWSQRAPCIQLFLAHIHTIHLWTLKGKLVAKKLKG